MNGCQEISVSKSVKRRAGDSWRIWTTAWMVTAVFTLSNSATPLYVHWQREIGFSNGTLTLVFAAYIAGLLATLLFAGQLSDRFGRKPVLFPGLAAAVFSCVLFSFASSVAVLLIARFLTGVAVGAIVSAGMAAVVDAGGSCHRQSASLAASVAMVSGAGLGPLLAGILAEGLAQPIVPIYSIQLVMIGSAFWVAAALPGKGGAGLHRERFRVRLPGVPAANRLHLACGISVFAPGITATSFLLSLGPSLFAKLLHVASPLVAGGTACVMFISATGVQFAMKMLPIRTIFRNGAAATILSMCFTTVAVTASSAWALVLAAILAGAGQGLGQLGGLTLIGLHVPVERRAEANAVLHIGGYIPAALLPVCSGYLIDVTGLATGATIFAVILSVAAMTAAIFTRARLKATAT